MRWRRIAAGLAGAGLLAAAGFAPPGDSGLRFDPDGPRPAEVMVLDADGSTACEAEVRALQAASKTWVGTLDEISLKLGQLQRTLYAGRCAGHPQAETLVASSERIIAQMSPRVHAAPAADADVMRVATDCLDLVPVGADGNPGNMSVFRNSCGYPVFAAYCNVAPAAGSWAEAFACETRERMGLVSVSGNGVARVVFGRQVNHLACAAPSVPVASYTPDSGLTGYCR